MNKKFLKSSYSLQQNCNNTMNIINNHYNQLDISIWPKPLITTCKCTHIPINYIFTSLFLLSTPVVPYVPYTPHPYTQQSPPTNYILTSCSSYPHLQSPTYPIHPTHTHNSHHLLIIYSLHVPSIHTCSPLRTLHTPSIHTIVITY